MAPFSFISHTLTGPVFMVQRLFYSKIVYKRMEFPQSCMLAWIGICCCLVPTVHVKADEALKARWVYPLDSTCRKRTLAPVYWGSGPPGTAA